MNGISCIFKRKIFSTIYIVGAITISWLLSYWLSLNLQNPSIYWEENACFFLPGVIAIQWTLYSLFGVNKGVWRFISLHDLWRIIKATISGGLIILIFNLFNESIITIPRVIPFLYTMIMLIIFCGGLIFYRWIKFHRHKFQNAKRILIVGAGSAGEQLTRDLLRQTTVNYLPVALVDDNTALHGREIHGITVIGCCSDISWIVDKYLIDLILIAVPSANSSDMRKIVSCCERTKIPFRTLPSVQDITDGIVNINTLRDVSLIDLLGRDPINLDWPGIENEIKQKTLLVTGGGGSIGSELCRQIARFHPEELVIVEQNEFNLYQLEMELSSKFPFLNFTSYLSDITDEKFINSIIETTKPDMIFHAAAYKHVPLLESQVISAIKNNILGSNILCKAAIKYNVHKFLLISTDKAVNPTSIMGITKRIAEILCQHYNHKNRTKFITVRFGNVLGSVGSVIPLFQKQISEGGPITITHPDITRYFMTISESAQLILQAITFSKEEEIFVLDMGEPINILFLANQMIRLAGLKSNIDIKIKFTGLRVGEKLYEELFYNHEEKRHFPDKKIFLITSKFVPKNISELIYTIETLILENNIKSLKSLVTNFVQEYNKDESNSDINIFEKNCSPVEII